MKHSTTRTTSAKKAAQTSLSEHFAGVAVALAITTLALITIFGNGHGP